MGTHKSQTSLQGRPFPSRPAECLVMAWVQPVSSRASLPAVLAVQIQGVSSLWMVCEAHPPGCSGLSRTSIEVLPSQAFARASSSQQWPVDAYRTREAAGLLSSLQSLA